MKKHRSVLAPLPGARVPVMVTRAAKIIVGYLLLIKVGDLNHPIFIREYGVNSSSRLGDDASDHCDCGPFDGDQTVMLTLIDRRLTLQSLPSRSPR